MDEQRMEFRFEAEDTVQPASEATAQTAQEPGIEQVRQEGFLPDKKVRRKIFWLVACMALVAALGGSALTAAIRAISDRNAVYQASVSGDGEEKPNDAQTSPQKEENAEGKTPATDEKPYTLEKAVLPETLPSNDGSKELTPAQVYEQNAASVVCIETTFVQELPEGTLEAGSVGSGFLLSGDGFILTSAHLVVDALSIDVTLYSEEQYEAQLVGIDETSDIALLKIEAEGLPSVSIAEEDSLHVGDEVVAIGNPFGELSYTMTHGYVSGLDREITIESIPIRMIQTDAPINSGNSGGPLLDMNGNVVGIAAAKYSGMSRSGVTIENVSFAIPIHDALEIAYDLQAYGYVTGRAYLGVTVLDLDASLAEDYGLPVGPRVETVTEGSCAEKAGIQPGDFILAIDERKTGSTNALLAALRDRRAGETVTVKLYRAGAELEVEVTLDERPADVN